MEQNKKVNFWNKLYGGMDMSWRLVILLALGSAALTAIFMTVPIFRNTSFIRMGSCFEAWIFFAVLVMANCQKPLESAVKVFGFFLVSQPMIYLFRVPFSPVGWGLFYQYPSWFMVTLATFPAAYVGWYIRKKNWLSLLILFPALQLLLDEMIELISFPPQQFVRNFPQGLVAALFCLGQVVVYLYVFTSNLWQKAVGFGVSLAVMLFLLARSPVAVASLPLPGYPSLTDEAVILVEDADWAELSVASTGERSIIWVRASKYGSTSFTIQDGEREYRYFLEIYEDGTGHSQVRITPVE